MKKALCLLVPLALALAMPDDARAQVVVTGGVSVGIAPPAAYIATSAPEYYGGRPHYYYNGYWYYRDRDRWMYYRHEPEYLRVRRAHWAPPPREHWRYEHREYRGSEWNGRYHYRR